MNNKLSRRSFLSGSAAALATASMAPIVTSCQPAGPSFPSIHDFGSKFGGVQIGAITYSWRSMPGGLENIVKYCKESGINAIELMSGDLETFLGMPSRPQQSGGGGGGGRGTPAVQLTPEEQAAQQAETAQYNERVKAFRTSVSPDKVAAAKKLFDDAGIGVHIVKFSPSRWSDEEIDYAFKTAKAMGAKAVCEEMSESAVKKLAPFAEKYDMYCVFHNHAQYRDVPNYAALVDEYLAFSPAVMLNFDCGHYSGTTGLNPCDYIRKYHDRIFTVHIKDKTGPGTEQVNVNQVWGQGQTPLAELFLMMKKEAGNPSWPISLDIELEYPIAAWSNAVKEVRTCVQYARNILI